MSLLLDRHLPEAEFDAPEHHGVMHYTLVQIFETDTQPDGETEFFTANITFIGRFEESVVDVILENLLADYLPDPCGASHWHWGRNDVRAPYGLGMIFISTDDSTSLRALANEINLLLGSKATCFVCPIGNADEIVSSWLLRLFHLGEWRKQSHKFPALLRGAGQDRGLRRQEIEIVGDCLQAILVPSVALGLVCWDTSDLAQPDRFIRFAMEPVTATSFSNLLASFHVILGRIGEPAVVLVTVPLNPPAKLKSVEHVMNKAHEFLGDKSTVVFASPLFASHVTRQTHQLFLVYVEEIEQFCNQEALKNETLDDAAIELAAAASASAPCQRRARVNSTLAQKVKSVSMRSEVMAAVCCQYV